MLLNEKQNISSENNKVFVKQQNNHHENNAGSYEKGSRMHERDRKRATQLFRTQSFGKSPGLSVDDEDVEHDVLLSGFEPDWSKFEHVFATGMHQGYFNS